MIVPAIADIKKELLNLDQPELMEICLRLARLKQDNKALLGYLLFQAGDEADYIRVVQEEMASFFSEINTASVYFIKKSLRKILRQIGRYAVYSGQKTTETELRLFFCVQYRENGFHQYQSKVLSGIYEAQVKKIRSLVKGLHEDLQYDYTRQLDRLTA
jgi:hypothetical protein